MAIEVSAELRAAIDAVERTPLIRVQLDWDGDGYGTTVTLPDGRSLDVDDLSRHAGAVTVDRTLTTELPDQVRLVAGSAAAEATVALNRGDPGDDSVDAASWFTRGSASPVGAKERLAKPATVDIGMACPSGPQYVRRLTGITRRLPTSAHGRTAELRVLDHRELLRDTVTLLPGSGPLSGYDGTFVVAQAFAANGFYAGPAPRASCMMWQPCYGSLLPVIPRPTGFSDWAFMITAAGVPSPRPEFVAGAFVSATTGGFLHSDTDFARPQLKIRPASAAWSGMRGRVEMWVLGVPSPTVGVTGSTGRHVVVALHISAEGTYAHVRHDSFLALLNKSAAGATLHSYTSTLAVPSDGRWHAVGISWDHNAGQVVFYLDGRTELVSTAITPGEFTAVPAFVQATAYAGYSDLHVSDVAVTDAWLGDTTVPNASIDRSALLLEACFEAGPREGWDLAAEVADAEQAVVLCDEQGVVRYRTRSRLVDTAGQTVQRTIRADEADLLEVDVDDGIDQVRNIIQVGYSPVTVATVQGRVYQDQRRWQLNPGQVLELWLPWPNPVVDLLPTPQLIALDADVDTTLSYVLAGFNADYSEGAAITEYAGLTWASVVAWNPTGAVVRLSNPSPQTAYVRGIGFGGLAATVGGHLVAEARSEPSIDTFGPQPLQLTLPQWAQRSDVAQGLANALLGDLRYPRRTLTRLLAVGDPTRQLGDREELDYPDRPELAGEYWLTSIRDDVTDAGAYRQTLALREATTVMRWGVGQWGINTWG